MRRKGQTLSAAGISRKVAPQEGETGGASLHGLGHEPKDPFKLCPMGVSFTAPWSRS